MFVEGSRVVILHERMTKAGLVREEATVGACDEGARGLLGAEETRRKSVGGTELGCVVVEQCKFELWWQRLGMHPLQK